MLLLAGAPGAAAGASGGPAPVPLDLRGNVVLLDEVYRAVLDLPAGLEVDRSTAALVRVRLLSFLRRAGYELARVETAVEEGRIRVEIDEGRLEQVIVRGQGTLRTVQVLLGLSLPHNVFNRPYLERQLAALRAQGGVEVEGYALVPTGEVAHVGPQVEDLGPIIEDLGKFVGRPLIPPRAAYELHIVLRRREWGTGPTLAAGLSGIEGLRLGLGYRGQGLWLGEDRWGAGAQLGVRVRERIADGGAYLALTRASAELQWFVPPLGPGLRPLFSARGELTSRQRPDVGLESYRATRVQLTLGLSQEVLSGATLALGVGGEQLNVFALSPVPGIPTAGDVGATSRLRPFLSGGVELVFDPEELRRDRRHELELDARHYPLGAGGDYGLSTYRYQKVFAAGWHDLWVTSRGAWLWGSPPFIEEQPVGGQYVRGVFGERFYTRRVASVGLEARLSLTRDVYKVGAFADVALFDDRARGSGSARPRGVASVGPSFHVLIADAFQLDLAYGIGFAARDDVERGFAATLRQAF